MLHCFHLASGLMINLHKRKLLGIVVNISTIEVVTTRIGCDSMKISYPYLGLTVDGKNEPTGFLERGNT